MKHRRSNLFRAFLLVAALISLGWVPTPPSEAPDRELTGGGTFASATNPSNLQGLLASCDYAFDNTNSSGGATRTLTVQPRGSGESSTYTVAIPAGYGVLLSGRGNSSVVADSADANLQYRFGPQGTIRPLQGFSGGGGASAAVSVSNDGFTGVVVTPNANSTLQMCGLGHSGQLTHPLVITPLRSGKILVTLSFTYVPANVANSILMKIAHGTGAAPNLNAAASGTLDLVLAEAGGVDGGAAGSYTLNLTVLISGLTIGTQIWVDAQAFVTSSTDTLTVYACSLVELQQ